MGVKRIYIFLFFSTIAFSAEAKIFSKEALEYRMKGYLAWQRKDYDEAIKYLQKACFLDPSYASPHNALGIIYESKGWREHAEKEYLKALSIDPNYGEAMMNLALLYQARGLVDKAIPYLQKRIEIGPPQDPWVLKAKALLSEYAPHLYKELSQKEEAKNLMYQVMEERLKGEKPLLEFTPEIKEKIEKEPEVLVVKEVEKYLRLERDLSNPQLKHWIMGLNTQAIGMLYGEPAEKRIITPKGKEIIQSPPKWFKRWIITSGIEKETTKADYIEGEKRIREKWLYRIPSQYKKYALNPEIILIFENNQLVSWEK